MAKLLSVYRVISRHNIHTNEETGETNGFAIDAIDENINITVTDTGIGLYIRKLVVEVHKGKIWAEGKEEIGITFHVVLPK